MFFSHQAFLFRNFFESLPTLGCTRHERSAALAIQHSLADRLAVVYRDEGFGYLTR